jgi:hypothetical protein
MVSSTSALDLSQLAPPEVVEQLSYEAIRAAIVDQLVAELPAFDATVTSDPAVKVLEVVAYREMLIRQQFNERARQVMLAYATGSNLDQLGALLDVGRLRARPTRPIARASSWRPRRSRWPGLPVPIGSMRFLPRPRLPMPAWPRPGPTISARWSWAVWPRKGPGPIWSRRWRPRSMRWSGRAR